MIAKKKANLAINDTPQPNFKLLQERGIKARMEFDQRTEREERPLTEREKMRLNTLQNKLKVRFE